MKKLTLILMAAMLMMTAGSCKKDKTDVNGDGNGTTTNDGIFNPSQKISKYYYWDEYEEEKILEQVWNWDGKQLSSIDYPNSSYSQYFTYDHNRLSRVDYNRAYVEFQYADGKLKKVSMYYDYELETEFTISHGSNNKISKIECVYYDGKKSGREMFDPLGLFLPRGIAANLESNREKRYSSRNAKDDGVETVSITLTWDGDNVVKAYVDGYYEEGDFYETFTEDYTCYYDNKNNPKYGYMDRYFPNLSAFSKNNITKYICTEHEMEYENGVLVEEENETYEYRFTYQYDEANYPTVVEETHSYESGSTYTYKYFYEYQ